MEKLVFFGPSFEQSFGNPYYTGSEESRQISALGTLVEALIQLEPFRDLDFLHILSLGATRSGKPFLIKDGEFELRGEEHYRLRVVQRRAVVEPIKDFVLSLDRSTLLPILSKQTAVGAYDILEFSFQTNPKKVQEQRTSLVLTAESKNASFPSRTLILPAVIPSHSLLWKGVPLAIFIVAGLVLLLPKLISTKLGIPAIPEEVKNAAIVAMIMTSKTAGAVGSSLVSKTFQIWK